MVQQSKKKEFQQRVCFQSAIFRSVLNCTVWRPAASTGKRATSCNPVELNECVGLSKAQEHKAAVPSTAPGSALNWRCA